jgi:X-Pro dipeptidyl-peptidase
MPSRPNLRLALGAAAALTVLALPAAPAAAQDRTPPPWLKVQDGVTQPQFPFENAIEEVVFVESEVDSDGDGARDRIRIRISRPGETESQGIDVPVVFEHSPYRGDLGSLPNHPVDVDNLPQESIGRDVRAAGAGRTARMARARSLARARARAKARAIPDLPGSLDNYYVPRGYAVVLGESIGTFNSDGCPDVGASGETLGTKAVIDWLNGRARGFNEAGERVRADWTTGAVGMIGVSYNGTLPNQVATTGVEGLETIVPISAISSWYDYYRANGLVRAPHSEVQGAGDNAFQGEDTDVLAAFTGGPRMLPGGECDDVLTFLNRAQDRVTGDWSPFWQARDYLRRVGNVESSVFVVHGLNDWNVMTKAFAEWWYRLARRGVPRKIWLHNGGHGGESATQDPADFAVYKRTENRWFDHWLFGVPNGIMSEPRASIEREDGTYVHEADWPRPGASQATLYLSARSATAPGELFTASPRWSREQGFVDRGRELDTDDVLIQNPDAAHPNRLIYRSPELGRDVRISGTPWVSLRMSIENRNAANLTAVLVDYAPAGAPLMVTRGWLDPQNRESLSRSEPIIRRREYRFRWDLQPDDFVFKAGHRIGLVVVSTDFDYTLRPLPGTELGLDPEDSEVSLPVVGGSSALGF